MALHRPSLCVAVNAWVAFLAMSWLLWGTLMIICSSSKAIDDCFATTVEKILVGRHPLFSRLSLLVRVQSASLSVSVSVSVSVSLSLSV